MSEKASQIFHRLAERAEILGSYDDTTNSLTLFAPTPSGKWEEFQTASDKARRRATKEQVFRGIWVDRPGAPTLNSKPSCCIYWDHEKRLFMPGVNVTIVRRVDFIRAYAEARAGCAEAELWRQQSGKLPTAADLDSVDYIAYPAADGRPQPPEIANLLYRMHSGG